MRHRPHRPVSALRAAPASRCGAPPRRTIRRGNRAGKLVTVSFEGVLRVQNPAALVTLPRLASVRPRRSVSACDWSAAWAEIVHIAVGTNRETAVQTFTIRDLRGNTGGIVRAAESGRLSVVTKHGQPIFVAVPFDEALLREGVAIALATRLFKEEAISLGKAENSGGSLHNSGSSTDAIK